MFGSVLPTERCSSITFLKDEYISALTIAFNTSQITLISFTTNENNHQSFGSLSSSEDNQSYVFNDQSVFMGFNVPRSNTLSSLSVITNECQSVTRYLQTKTVT